MKKMIGTILFLVMIPFIINAQGNSQGAVVAASKMNVLYSGISNPIEIAVPGVSSDKVTATITNGTIKKVANGWDVIPGGQAESTITVFVDNKKVSEKEFRVKSIPNPVAVFAGRSNGAISKDVALKTEVIEAELPDFVFDIKYEIVSFVFLVTKDNMDYEEISKSNKLTDKMKTLITGLVSVKSIFFKDIKARAPDGRIVELTPLLLKIN
jgi:gliding motility-associated protein GldM